MIAKVNCFSDIEVSPYLKNPVELKNNNVIRTEQTDSFEKEDKSKNGKFDKSEAVKNFGKGIIKPIKTALEHPLLTIGIVGATVSTCTIIPVLMPVLTVGFLAVSSFELAKGGYNLINNLKSKKYDEAEKSFEGIGEGTMGTVLGVLGIKSASQIAKEAKITKIASKSAISDEEKILVANEVEKNSFIKNIKEVSELFTTKTGRTALISQFKPSFMKKRTSDLIENFKGGSEKQIENITKKELNKEFKNTPEGIRRAKLTNEEIEKMFQDTFNKVFDELGIKKEHRPQFEVLHLKDGTKGGCYNSGTHKIVCNSTSYREGYCEIEDVIMHEATHTKQAILRAGIPQERANELVKRELINRIINGENEQVTVKSGFFGAKMTKPPKLPQAMKQDFIEFAKKYLYVRYQDFNKVIKDYDIQNKILIDRQKYCDAEVLKSLTEVKFPEPIVELKTLMNKYPEYKAQYKDENEAFEKLLEYSLSHNSRYNSITNLRVGMPKLNIPELKGEELKLAEKSLIDNISTLDGNNGISGFNGIFPKEKVYNQYQFCPEEVLAQQKGNDFLIRSFSTMLSEMKKKNILKEEDEAYLTYAIEKAKATVDYKTKGLEYYQKYTQMINNPNDKKLKSEVDLLEEELAKLKEKVDIRQFEIVRNFVTVRVKQDVLSSEIPINAIYELLNQLKSCKS